MSARRTGPGGGTGRGKWPVVTVGRPNPDKVGQRTRVRLSRRAGCNSGETAGPVPAANVHESDPYAQHCVCASHHVRPRTVLKGKIFTCRVTPGAAPFRWDCMVLLSESAWCPPVARLRVSTIGLSGVPAVMISAIRRRQIRDPGRLCVCAGRLADSLPADGVIFAAPFGNRVSGLTLAVNGYRPGAWPPRPRRFQSRCAQGERRPCDRCLVSDCKGINTQSNIRKLMMT